MASLTVAALLGKIISSYMNNPTNFPRQLIPILRKPKLIILIGVILILLIFTIIQQQASQTPPPIQPATPPPPPNLPTSQPNRDLKIIWNINTNQSSFPQTLSYYQSIPISFDTQYTDNLVSYLGFAPNHLLSTNKQARLWVNGHLSLNINLPHGPLTFIDSSIPDPIQPPTLEFLLQSATQHLGNIFPSLPINPDLSTVKYLAVEPNTTAFKETSPNLAEYTSIGFRQTIEDYPIITQSGTTTPITIVLNNYGQIQQLEVISLISQYQKISDNIPVLSIEELRQIAPQQATKVSIEKIDTETDLSRVKDQTLTVNQLDLVYLSLSNDNILQPVFRLTGILSTSITSRPAVYIVPAFAKTNPQQ